MLGQEHTDAQRRVARRIVLMQLLGSDIFALGRPFSKCWEHQLTFDRQHSTTHAHKSHYHQFGLLMAVPKAINKGTSINFLIRFVTYKYERAPRRLVKQFRNFCSSFFVKFCVDLDRPKLFESILHDLVPKQRWTTSAILTCHPIIDAWGRLH